LGLGRSHYFDWAITSLAQTLGNWAISDLQILPS
jgi:hypothetical protein